MTVEVALAVGVSDGSRVGSSVGVGDGVIGVEVGTGDGVGAIPAVPTLVERRKPI